MFIRFIMFIGLVGLVGLVGNSKYDSDLYSDIDFT